MPVLAGRGRSGTRAIDVVVVATSPPRRAVRGFERWVASSTPPGSAVLNVGGGCNRSGEFARVRRRAGYLVAVDPSERIGDNVSADERHQQTLEEYATEHPAEFDVAFAVFVLEHIDDPDAFIRAAARVLKPGGAFLAITVNQWHYFGFVGWLATRLNIAEPLLRLVREQRAITAYHYPTTYRINSVRTASRYLAAAGFSSVEFRMWDLPAMYEPYLPKPLRWFAATWHRMAYATGRPQLMGHLTLKAVRGHELGG